MARDADRRDTCRRAPTRRARRHREVGGRLYRISFSVLRDRLLAEDATQQAMVEIWRSLPRLRDPARFEAWSYRIAVHACYAEAKRSRRTLPSIRSGPEPRAPDAYGAVHDRDALERAFRNLSVDQRAVVVLRDYVGMPLREVAVVLGIPEGTAHSRHDRAMTKLRSALEAEAAGPGGVAQEVSG